MKYTAPAKAMASTSRWPSPISAEIVASASSQPQELNCFGDEHWWLERDPDRGGRVDIIRSHHGQRQPRLPPKLSCRSRVHEYGGGSYCVCQDGVYFVNDQDQHIYYLAHDDQLRCICQSPLTRYADLSFDPARACLFCIQELHSDNNSAQNSLIRIDPTNGVSDTLASGYDFYASPSLSPDGKQLAWLCWNHPDMPWDSSELWLADLDHEGNIVSSQRIAGGDGVSVFQPSWSQAQQLFFVDDRSGWWNLYSYTSGQTRALYPSELEFGLPQWVFSQRSYAVIDEHRLLVSYYEHGNQQLALLNHPRQQLTPISNRFNSFTSLCVSTDCAAFIAASDSEFAQTVQLDLETLQLQSLSKPAAVAVAADYYSRPQTIEFTTRHGDTAYAFYYPAHNPDCDTDSDFKPPLIVITHGGPTARSDAALDLRKQYWTTRGYSLLDVNYSGSTGYGRAYRDRLHGQWGVRDAEDCCDAALHLVNAGLVDAERLIIKGSSAGGYTVLCALTFHNVFAAGASYYGIAELEALAKHTHKFEAHYLDRLVGPYPEMQTTYQQRSPIHYVDQLNCPVIFFQGTEDKVVPQEQADMMFAALRQKGVATSYLAFAGEAHGFRKAQTQIDCLHAEQEFYARVLGLPLPDETTETLKIENLERQG